MNRRKLLTLSTGLAFGAFAATTLKAQELTTAQAKPQEPPLWFIHEDELKTGIVLPSVKKPNKSIVTNRFDGFSPLSDRLIRQAEAVYPYYNPGLEVERGKPLWYSDGSHKTPFNITPRAVNYYFNLALRDEKHSTVHYKVEVAELISITKESISDKGFGEMPNIYEVSLSLSYGRYYSSLGAESFGLRKKVVFSREEEIIALYMPPKPTVFMS